MHSVVKVLSVFCLSFFFFSPVEATTASTLIAKNSYVRPISCPKETWSALEPYFLPTNHPIKAKLDALFSKARLLTSKNHLKKAGFAHPSAGSPTHAYVMTHPHMPGYFFKAYLDTQVIDDADRLLKRVLGAQAVQNTLDTYALNHLIKVPKKWIYPLPPEPAVKISPHTLPKHFILVSQDMDVLSKKSNEHKWKKAMNHELLTAIYIVISDNRMIDSIRIENIPFSNDGKIAFIDTEFFNIPESYARVRYWKLFEYLSSEMAAYLKGLAENGITG